VRVDRLDVSVYTIPLDAPQSDATLTWDRTVVVVVEAYVGDVRGLGFTYGTDACATFIRSVLEDVVVGVDAMDVSRAWERMVRAIRNQGRPGVASMAIAAVDTALWDLKARLLGVPLAGLLGMVRDAVPVYGSGGFTSLSDDDLAGHLAGWVHDEGITRVKMKVGMNRGAEPGHDVDRVALARKAIGSDADLFVDANGGYTAKQAVRLGRQFTELGVSWFEEPVSSDDLEGLHRVRNSLDLDVTAGEYGYDLAYFRRMLAAEAVDCLQVDVSRCGGITEFLRVAALAAAHGLQLSTHTAQSLSVHPCTAVPNVRHLEYFADHARAERLLFEGVLDPVDGDLRPDLSHPGTGLELRRPDAEAFRTG
jgi:L-alanine-DL-glutamate epimerase-like enolase superfamily enzyme